MWPVLLVLMLLGPRMFGQTAASQRVAGLLPKDAQIIESAKVPLRGAKKRTLVLWMKAPRKVMAQWDSGVDFIRL